MKINNIQVQAPIKGDFVIDPVEYSKMIRTASGRMVKDISNIKYNFTLNYVGLKYSDYSTFLNAYILGNPVLFEYEDNNINVHKTVYITSMPRGLYQDLSSISHSISIKLEEV